MMFYSDILPSMHPVMLAPRPRTQCCRPQTAACHPMRMRAAIPEVIPASRWRKRRAHDDGDFLSHLLALSNSDDDDSSSDSDEQEFLDFLSMFGYRNNCDKKECKKSNKVPKKGQDEKSTQSETDEKSGKANPNEEKEGKESDVIEPKLDMRGYDPQTIKVKTSEETRTVTVRAQRVHRTLYGPVVSERTYVYHIDDGVDLHSIRSFISPDGLFHLKVSEAQDSVAMAEPDEDVSRGHSDKEPTRDADSSEKVEKEEPKIAESVPVVNETSEANKTESMETNLSNDTNISEDKEDEDENDELKAANSADKAEVEIEEEHFANNTTDKSDEERKDTYDVIIAQFDMRGFESDDVTVDINEKTHTIEISAQREEKTPSGVLRREYYRAVPLPEDISLQDVRSHLSEDGVFLLQAPCALALTE